MTNDINQARALAILINDRVLTRTRESESKKVPIEGESFAENTRNFRENFPVTDA